jgi:hypothetical protein
MNILPVILNPNDLNSSNTLSNGDLTLVSGSQNAIRATHGKSSGKWYWEVKFDSGNSSTWIGISNKYYPVTLSSSNSNWRSYYGNNGTKHPENTPYGSAWVVGDIIGVALDLDNGTLEFYKNGSSMGISHTNINELGEAYPTIGVNGNVKTNTFNFGTTPFTYSVPKGFLAYNNEPTYKSLILNNSTYYYNSIKKLDIKAHASSTANSSWLPESAINENITTNNSIGSRWCSALISDDPEPWFMINFSKEVELNKIKFLQFSASETYDRIKDCILEFSDGSQYTYILPDKYVLINQTITEDNWSIIEFPSKSSKSIKIIKKSAYGGKYGYTTFIEFEAYLNDKKIRKGEVSNAEWNSLPSPPIEQDYLDYGMDDISIIPESDWQELEGEVELCYYTDDPNKSEASFNITTTPFTLAEEWEDKTISVIEYTDDPNSSESSITLETEPFTIYDELGDDVDVLYYTDDPDKNEAKLNITANYSPLDELEGDFDVVTYSEDLDESDTLSLNVEALPFGQLVIQPNSFKYLGEIKSFISHLVNSNNVGIIRFIISFDNGATWKSYSKGLDTWRAVNVNISDHANVIKYGMRYQAFNDIPEHQITAHPNGNIKLAYYIEETKHLNQPIGIDYISYRSLVPQEDVKFGDVAFYVLNTTASIKLDFGGNKLTGTLSDEDLTKVQYRVLLNGKPYHPISGDFTRLNASPLNISLNIDERDIIFGQENMLRVEFKDTWGQEAYKEIPFTGTYSGIMFKDASGKYLSNSFGDILKRLDFDVIIAGQISLEQKVIAKNETGQRVQNLLLEVNKDVLPEGVELQLSRSIPFINEEPLLFNKFFEPDEELEFYVRIKTDIEAPANANGLFEVKAKVQPV